MNIWMAALMTFILSVGGLAARAADFKAGFGGVEWNADIFELPQLQFLYEKESVAFYTDTDREYTVNDISVGPVIYGFQHGKFFAAYINFNDLAVFAEVNAYLKDKYGLPKSSIRATNNVTVHQWQTGDIRIKLKQEADGGRMKLAFYYYPIAKVLNESRLEEFETERFQFFPIEKDRQPEMIPLLRF